MLVISSQQVTSSDKYIDARVDLGHYITSGQYEFYSFKTTNNFYNVYTNSNGHFQVNATSFTLTAGKYTPEDLRVVIFNLITLTLPGVLLSLTFDDVTLKYTFNFAAATNLTITDQRFAQVCGFDYNVQQTGVIIAVSNITDFSPLKSIFVDIKNDENKFIHGPNQKRYSLMISTLSDLSIHERPRFYRERQYVKMSNAFRYVNLTFHDEFGYAITQNPVDWVMVLKR